MKSIRGSRAISFPKEFISTDPYCPPVRTTSLDDTPLVVKSSEKLPAMGERLNHTRVITEQGGATGLTYK